MDKRDESRRAFLQTAARWLILPAAGAGVGAMASRRGEKCEADFICSRCRESGACLLPQAVSYRDRRKEEGLG